MSLQLVGRSGSVMANKAMNTPNNLVYIEVSGGVADVIFHPDNVEVYILDWDNLEDRDMTCPSCKVHDKFPKADYEFPGSLICRYCNASYEIATLPGK
jgi:hypothetical protein